MGWHPTERRVVACISDGKPCSHREILKKTGLGRGPVWACLRRCWQKGLLLRTERPIRETNRVLKGRAGVRTNLRSYYLYLLDPKHRVHMDIGDLRFARHQMRAASHRASKARLILESLRKHRDRAFFSKDIANSLEDSGVRILDIMSNVRRFERQGLIYVRGYRMHDRHPSRRATC